MCVALAGLGLGAAGASAATTTVDCSSSNPLGTSVSNPADDLQDVLNGAASGDTVIIDGLCTGTFTLPEETPLTVEGASGTTSGFDGQDGDLSGPMLYGNELDEVTLQDLTFENAYTPTSDGASALYADSYEGTLTLNDDTFTNDATIEAPDGEDLDESPVFLIADYGPSECENQDNSIDVENSTFSDNALGLFEFEPAYNVAGGGAGLGVFVECDLDPTTLTDNQFTDNDVESFFDELPGVGAGLSIIGGDYGSPVPVTQSGNVFSDNAVQADPDDVDSFWGGAGEWAESVDLTSTDDSFVDNTLPGSDSDFGSLGAGLGIAGSCGSGSSYAELNQDVVADNTIAMDSSEDDAFDDAEGAGVALLDYPIELYSPDFGGEYYEFVCEIEGPRLGALAHDTRRENALRRAGASAFRRAGALSKRETARQSFGAVRETARRSFGTVRILNQPADEGDLTLDDTTVNGNAITDGGTVAATDSGGTAGVWVGDDQTDDVFLELDNTILDGDVGGVEDTYFPIPFDGPLKLAGTVNAPAVPAGEIAVNYSDLCDDGVPFTGPGNICADPLLLDDGYDPSAATPDVHETSSSPTIDAGSNDLIASGLISDFYGDTRAVAGHTCPKTAGTVDIGAAEYLPSCPSQPAPSVVTPTPSQTPTPAPAPAPSKVQPCESRRDIVMHLQYTFFLASPDLIARSSAKLTSLSSSGFGTRNLQVFGPHDSEVRLDLKTLPFGTYRVHAYVTLTDGKSLYQQREWHTCRPFHWKYPPGKPRHNSRTS